MSRRQALLAVLLVAVLGAGVLAFVVLSRDDPAYPPLADAMVEAMAKQGDTFAPDPDETQARREDADRLGRRYADSPRLTPGHTIAVSFGRATRERNNEVRHRDVWVVYIDGYTAQCLGICEPGESYGVGDYYAFIDPVTLRTLSAREF